MGVNGKVFILDDDRIFLELYNKLLEDRGYSVFTTDNAYKFLLYGRELIPDVMFLDVNMPRINGWEVLQRINRDEILQSIPVAMLTVSQDDDLAAAKGVAHFLHKPLAAEEMADILESYCRGNKNHDVLLIEDYEPRLNDLKQKLRQKGCFVTHSLTAAERYLQKNKPKKICVRYNPQRFAEAKQKLRRDDMFRVESAEDFADLPE